jgi:hypothetical protein
MPISWGESDNGGDEPCGLDVPHDLNHLRQISLLLDYGVPVFTDDFASPNYPVFKGPATL